MCRAVVAYQSAGVGSALFVSHALSKPLDAYVLVLLTMLKVYWCALRFWHGLPTGKSRPSSSSGPSDRWLKVQG